MKKYLFFLFSLIFTSVSAQYGNEWIDYSKPYFKIKVNTEGIYRINASVLNSVGLNFVNSNNFQLFRNGKQIPLYINKTGAIVNYIEFYAYGNDGKIDSTVFKDKDWQMHDKYSLFSDEAIYFLTFNDVGGNLRINDITNSLTGLPPKEQYFYYNTFNLYKSSFSYGEYAGTSDPLYSSLFSKGEGFMGSGAQQINNSATTKTFNISSPNKYNSASLPSYLNTVVVGWTRKNHHFKIRSNSTLINEYSFYNYDLIKSKDTISSSLVNATTSITLEAIPTSSGTNRNTLALLELDYPREYKFGNNSFFKFTIEGNGNVQYLEIENFDNQNTQPLLYDISNGYRVKAIDASSSSMFRYALPAANGKREIILRADNNSNYSAINSLSEFYFKDYSSSLNQGDYIILTHPNLISSPELLAYRDYRQSINGGSYDVEIVDINELYDQFAYGIDHHPAAVQHFISYANNNFTSRLKYLFIIGKGREYHHYRNNTAVRNACLVPTFGQPGSDNLLAADDISDVPNVPIGRIAASTADKIDIYLQKVIQYETEQNNFGDPYQTVANKAHMKELIHLGGGSDAGQQNTFKSFLNNYKTTAEDTLWGANVYSVFKTNSNPLQAIQTDVLKEKIDEGVSLITFFGHSYAGGFDLSFDEPENYTNQGKYTIYLANGCNSGAIHNGSTSISERFVFADQKAAVAYLSTTSLSIDQSLNIFSNYFYKNLANSNYTKGIGDIVQETVANVVSCCNNNAIQMLTPHEMTLNGDPAIKFNQYDRPDYNIEAQNVSFTPNIVSTSIDSFEINLLVYNLGKAIDKQIDIEVSRILPNGDEIVVVKTVDAPYYKETFSLKFPVLNNNEGLGLNKFNIYVDNTDVVSNELSETNNYLLNSINLVIGSDDIYPVYPYEFAIVPQQGVTLKASTGNAFAPVRTYKFQIDTSELFLNPLDQTSITISGGLVEWNPNITMEDSTVYYWRVSEVTNSNWQYSSFIFLNNEYLGWNQSHYYQWQKDSYNNIELDTTRKFKFVDDVKDIFVRTGVYPNIPYQHIEWQINGGSQHNWSMNNCSGGGGFHNGLSIALIDNITGLGVENYNTGDNYGPYGNIHCSNNPDYVYVANFQAYGNTPANHPTPNVLWSDLIIDFLNNVPNNFYVLIYSVNNPQYGSWNSNLINYLNNEGSSINNGTLGPMILMYQKNNASFTPVSNIGTSFNDIISEHIAISGLWNKGNIESTTIGPALKWGSFHWRYHSQENPTLDNQKVEIYGLNNAGNEIFITTITNILDTTLTFIDANIYPYLRLKLVAEDLQDRTPTQLEYWRVLYHQAPEGVMNPNLFFETNLDTLKQGNEYQMTVAFENITPWAMDSLWVKNSIHYANNSFEENSLRYDSLRAFDTLHLKFNKNTLNSKFIGNNSYIIEANPNGAKHQIEQFHFNNFAILNFNVLGDNENPLLDVTFDGIHILDGDIVSAEPTINIQLKDESRFLALDDTAVLQIFIRDLEDGKITKMSYLSEQVEFYPAKHTDLEKNNKALVVLKAKFPKDGTYELIVKAKDASGNSSSGVDNRIIDFTYYDYKVSFEIINKSSISNVLNYPNPFTTQTHFVFTLTGKEIPDYFEIKIYNIKGTLIKQITKEELGIMHIGVNKTEYTWDGTDQFGDKLANGVYLYKVYTSIDNEEVEHRDIQQVDKFFQKGFGKMVFIR